MTSKTCLDRCLHSVAQDSLFYSMAINMASGLLFGTVLTLGVVPVLYAVLFRVKVPG